MRVAHPTKPRSCATCVKAQQAARDREAREEIARLASPVTYWDAWAEFHVEGFVSPLLATLPEASDRAAQLAEAARVTYQGRPVSSVRFERAPRTYRGRGSDGRTYHAYQLVGVSDGVELVATKSRGRFAWSLRGLGLTAPFPRGMPCAAVAETIRRDEAARLPMHAWALPLTYDASEADD